MNRPRVFLSRQLPPPALDKLTPACEVQVWPGELPPPRDELLARVAGCDGLLLMLSDHVDAQLMDAAGDQLRVISNYAVGINNIDVPEAARRGIRIGNTPDVLTDATADVAAMLLLAAARGAQAAADTVRQGQWKTWQPTGLLGVDLVGRTLGIVGMGRIGQATAKRFARGWDMKIVYTSRSSKVEAEQELGARRVDFQELLRISDFVSIHTDLNDQTHGMFDAAAFEQMKSNAILINTSRGGVVDQEALVGALQSGQIRAAGLDVTTPEPLPSDHPLVHQENCLIMPHIGSATQQTRAAMAEIAADNILAGIRGEPLRCEVGG